MKADLRTLIAATSALRAARLDLWPEAPMTILYQPHEIVARCPGRYGKGQAGARLLRTRDGRHFLLGDGRVLEARRPGTIRRWASLVRSSASAKRLSSPQNSS